MVQMVQQSYYKFNIIFGISSNRSALIEMSVLFRTHQKKKKKKKYP